MVLLFGIVALIILAMVAMVLYDLNRSDRSMQFEEHVDGHMEAIAKQRVRRNLSQGG